MEKSTLIEILRTFSKDELASFGDFIQSPYHNKKSNVTKLFDVIRKHAPRYPAEKTGKEEAWKKIYPGKKYNYGIMKNLIFDLNKLAVKFLELESYSQKEYEQDLNQLDGFRQKNLKQQFVKRITETRKNLENRPLDNQSHYYRYMLYCCEMSYMDYELLFDKKDTDYHSGVNESLLLYYCTNQLHQSLSNLQYAYNRSAAINVEIPQKALQLYDDAKIRDPFTEIIKNAYIALAGPGRTDDYENLKRSFFANYKKCSLAIQYDLAVAMINFCRNRAQKGYGEFIKDEFIYLRLLIEGELYKLNGFGWLDQYLYMQSVMSACRAGEFEWAERFIEKYKPELIESVREQYSNLAHVTLNLRRGKFKEALHYLSLIKNVEKGDKLNIKVFEFNAYYELDYYDELKSLADTTRHLLRSDKLYSKDDKAEFGNYVKAITWLMEYKCGSGKKKGNLELLKRTEEFVRTREMRNKIWLLQKIEELKKKL